MSPSCVKRISFCASECVIKSSVCRHVGRLVRGCDASHPDLFYMLVQNSLGNQDYQKKTWYLPDGKSLFGLLNRPSHNLLSLDCEGSSLHQSNAIRIHARWCLRRI